MAEKRSGGRADERQVTDYCLEACDGECCKKIAFIIKPQPSMRQLLRVHYGTEIEEVKFLLRHTCPHLTDEGLCELWHEDPKQDERPDFCKNFLCGRAQKRRVEFDAWDIEID